MNKNEVDLANVRECKMLHVIFTSLSFHDNMFFTSNFKVCVFFKWTALLMVLLINLTISCSANKQIKVDVKKLPQIIKYFWISIN